MVDTVLNALIGLFVSNIESKISKLTDCFEKCRIWLIWQRMGSRVPEQAMPSKSPFQTMI
jgi:hypothetical protein